MSCLSVEEKRLRAVQATKRWRERHYSDYLKMSKESNRRWRHAHHEESCKLQRNYGRTHRTEHYAYMKKYRKTHRIQMWAYTTINNHKRKGYVVKLTTKELYVIIAKSPSCYICGCIFDWNTHRPNTLRDLTRPTLDRVDNSNVISKDNVAIACTRCNTAKNNMDLYAFIQFCRTTESRLGNGAERMFRVQSTATPNRINMEMQRNGREKYYGTRKMRHNAYMRKYRKTHPARCWVVMTIANHKRHGYTVTLTTKDLFALVQNCPACYICGQKFDWDKSRPSNTNVLGRPTLDRLDNGCVISKDNIAIACTRCNTSKNDMDLITFIQFCKMVVNRVGADDRDSRFSTERLFDDGKTSLQCDFKDDCDLAITLGQ